MEVLAPREVEAVERAAERAFLDDHVCVWLYKSDDAVLVILPDNLTV